MMESRKESFACRILCIANNEFILIKLGNVFKQFYLLYSAQCLEPTEFPKTYS